jgi:hypothetical protein
MKTLLLSACAAAMIAAAAAPASAGQFTMNDNGPSGPIIAAGDSRYYDDDGPSDNDWRYPSQGYGDQGNYGYGNQRYGNGYGYGNSYGYGNGYGNYGVVPPYAIVRYLDRSGFSYITQPALSGRFYQVKARDPNGRKVKLWIDAYNGHIVKVKKK